MNVSLNACVPGKRDTNCLSDNTFLVVGDGQEIIRSSPCFANSGCLKFFSFRFLALISFASQCLSLCTQQEKLTETPFQ